MIDRYGQHDDMQRVEYPEQQGGVSGKHTPKLRYGLPQQLDRTAQTQLVGEPEGEVHPSLQARDTVEPAPSRM